jgi:hypothetical protein
MLGRVGGGLLEAMVEASFIYDKGGFRLNGVNVNLPGMTP